MPISGIRSPALFGGLPTGGVLAGEDAPAVLPRGFDAVTQCDQRLVQIQLGRNLHEAGVSVLRVKVPYAAEGLPTEVHDAVAPHLTVQDIAGLDEIALELRLLDPQLQTMGAAAEPPRGGVVLESDFDVDEEPFELGWTLELNLLRIEHEQVLTQDTAARTSARSRNIQLPTGGVLELPDRPRTPDITETRVRLATGRAVTRMPAHIVARPDLLQAWLELDTARTATVALAEDPPLTALLQTTRGQDLLRTALAALTSHPGVRASPRIAVAGSLAPQHVAGLGLTGMRVRHVVHRRPDGSEVLSLAFTFGDDAGGALSELQPFLGPNHFAYHVTRETLVPVLQTRWRLRPAAREFVGDVPIEMPLHEGAEEHGEGIVRLRVRLAELSSVGLMALQSTQGDVLRLGCDEEVQLLAAWYANGSQVDDLGGLGEPATLPFVINVAPFTPAPAGTERDTPLRDFLLAVLEPLALPMVERFRIHRVDGFLSEALGACVARWSMPTRMQETTGGLPDDMVIGR